MAFTANVLGLLMFLVASLWAVQARELRAPEIFEAAREVESHQIPTPEETLTLMAEVPIATPEAEERFEATKAVEKEQTLTLGGKGPLSLPLFHRDINHGSRVLDTSSSEFWTRVLRRDQDRVAAITASIDFQLRGVCPNGREALEFTGIPIPAACIKKEEIEKAAADLDNFLLSSR